jgi:hypothetical protein
MKHFYLLFFLSLSFNIFSQSYENIKKLDTIYISFKNRKHNIKIDYPEEIDGFKNRRYMFNYKKKNEYGFDFEFKKNPSKIVETIVINKELLKKNKEKIVEIDSLKKFDYQDIQCELFNQLKTFYIIDFSEKKGKNIKLYQVVFMGHCIVYE